MTSDKAVIAQRKWLKTELKYQLACAVFRALYNRFVPNVQTIYAQLQADGFKWDGEMWRRGIHAVELVETEADELPY